MKFDCVVMNPPYQGTKNRIKDTNKGTCGTILWPEFVRMTFDILQNDGYLCSVHPSNWRRPNNRTQDIGELLKSKNMIYLSLHSIEDGIKTFGATTNYDWYICQNSDTKNITIIRDFNGEIDEINISSLPLLPNMDIKRAISLIALKDDDKCDFIYSRSAYGTDKSNMNKEKTGDYQYPCVYSLPQKGMQLFYSNTKDNGHFGVPKVIFSNGAASQVIIDKEGKYGLTQFAYGIIDEAQNLSKIKQALESKKFIELCESFRFTLDKYDYGCIRCFRKDFWKEFV